MRVGRKGEVDSEKVWTRESADDDDDWVRGAQTRRALPLMCSQSVSEPGKASRRTLPRARADAPRGHAAGPDCRQVARTRVAADLAGPILRRLSAKTRGARSPKGGREDEGRGTRTTKP